MKVPGQLNPWIACCWTECDRPGDTRYEFEDTSELKGIQVGTGKKLYIKYLFCSDRHRVMWINSTHDMGNMPMGSKGLLT